MAHQKIVMKEQLVTARYVLDAISNEKSQDLFHLIAAGENSCNVLDGGKMTRKQYYPKLTKLLNANLIKRTGGMYTLTTFGKIVYEAGLGLVEAINNR